MIVQPAPYAAARPPEEEEQLPGDVEEELELTRDGEPMARLAATLEMRLDEWSGVFRLRAAGANSSAPAQLMSNWLDTALLLWSNDGTLDDGAEAVLSQLVPYGDEEQLSPFLADPADLPMPSSSGAPSEGDPYYLAVARSWGPLCAAIAWAALPDRTSASAAGVLGRLALMTCGQLSIPVGFATLALHPSEARSFAHRFGLSLQRLERRLSDPSVGGPIVQAALRLPRSQTLLEELGRSVRLRRSSLAELGLDRLVVPAARPRVGACEEAAADARAGGLIGLREPLHELRKTIGERLLARHIHTTDDRTIDWNPTLSSLFLATEEIGRWIDRELVRLVGAEDFEEADRAIARPLQATRAVAAMLSGIVAAQWVLHETEIPLLGGEALSDDLLPKVDTLQRLVDELRAAPPTEEVTERIDDAVQDVIDLIELYSKLFVAELALMATVAVAATIALVVALAKAMASVAAAAVIGGRTIQLATAAGGPLVVAEVQVIAAGVVATAATAAALKSYSGGTGPTRAGQRGERRAFRGPPPPKESFPSMVRGGKFFRIPDKLTPTTLQEVKNVLNLSLTRQLTDFILYSGLTDRRMIIWVRARRVAGQWKQVTRLSRPLQDFVNAGDIRIRLLTY